MKVAGSALVHILCGVALASKPVENRPQLVPAQTLLATSTGHLGSAVQHVYKRKAREDPANPVAAAATDPNEAAIMIKSRDLVPTDRPNFHSEVHHHKHGDQDDADSSGGGNDDDDDDSGRSERKKSSTGKSKAKGSSKADHSDDSDDDSNSNDDDDSSSHSQKSKDIKDSKDKGKGKGKGNDKDKDKDKDKGKDKDKSGSKQKSKGKGDDDKKGKKNKNTHTGLDGNEVDNEDDEDGQGGDPNHKKVKVKHVEAKQRHWRTGKPNYNYKKALAGWKEVGPLYYFKGKYENAAPPTAASRDARHLFVPVALALGFAAAPFI
ncbi:hypothetical protein EV175_003903 [Coemansia sp. RSA 1933]|nr:hypothetical protein EV175_003903 [Coemansia sp. RSA 1933]